MKRDMPDRTATTRPPLVLIANEQEWSTRTLESILGPSGYAVLRAYTGKDTLERARTAQPDLVLISDTLADQSGLEVCRELRAQRIVGDATAILIITPGPSSREQRIAALHAGANEYLGHPLDADELPLRLHTYVRAKFEADRGREESLLDQGTGLYNMQGLARRGRELGAHAFRNHTALACVVFTPEMENGTGASEAQVEASIVEVARTLKATGRISDAIGRLGPTEFAVIAPETDAAGAVKLAERLVQALKGPRLKVGYDSVANYREAPIEPMDMLIRATSALRVAKTDRGAWIQPFEDRFSTLRS
jgi:diguanylate cyclase (GGDEF)-like protein